MGEYTALVEVIFGHEDHFGAFDGHLLENKIVLHRGAPDTSTVLSALPKIGIHGDLWLHRGEGDAPSGGPEGPGTLQPSAESLPLSS